MVIEFSCSQCQRLLRTSDDKAGRTAKCPDCQTPITVPQAGSAPPDFSDEPAAFREHEDNTTPCPMCGAENDSWVKRCQSCGEELTHVGVRTADGYMALEFAPLGSRFVAIIIDIVITLIMNFSVGLAIGLAIIAAGKNMNRAELDTLETAANALGFVLVWLYYTLQESSEKQATVGKRVMGLMVATVDGERLSFMHATGRYLSYFLGMILCTFFGASMWMAAFTEKKQTFHDMISKTVVYSRPK